MARDMGDDRPASGDDRTGRRESAGGGFYERASRRRSQRGETGESRTSGGYATGGGGTRDLEAGGSFRQRQQENADEADYWRQRERSDSDERHSEGGRVPAGDVRAATEMGIGFGAGKGLADVGGGRRNRWEREPSAAHEIMTRNPRTVFPDTPVRDIAQIMRAESTGIVPVVDESGRLRGVVTDRDVVMRTIAEGINPLEATAREVMSDDVEAVTPDESVHDVVHLMGRHQIRRVPVVDRDDRLVGIISLADVATRADTDEELQSALERISARRSFWRGLFG